MHNKNEEATNVFEYKAILYYCTTIVRDIDVAKLTTYSHNTCFNFAQL